MQKRKRKNESSRLASHASTGCLHFTAGLLPFAVFFHCCFGLWMHTYFMSVDPDSDSKAIFITNTGEHFFSASQCVSSVCVLQLHITTEQRSQAHSDIAFLLIPVNTQRSLLMHNFLSHFSHAVPTNTTFDGTNQFGTTLDKRTIGSRISQPNGFGLLILAFIMFIWLIYRCAFLLEGCIGKTQ